MSAALASASSQDTGIAARWPEAQEEQDQEAVDKRDGGLEEVVVVRGDELAEFVDEQPEAGSANQRRQPLAPFADHGQQEHERNEHEQSAPEHVGDVKSASAHARKPVRP